MSSFYYVIKFVGLYAQTNPKTIFVENFIRRNILFTVGFLALLVLYSRIGAMLPVFRANYIDPDSLNYYQAYTADLKSSSKGLTWWQKFPRLENIVFVQLIKQRNLAVVIHRMQKRNNFAPLGRERTNFIKRKMGIVISSVATHGHCIVPYASTLDIPRIKEAFSLPWYS